MKFLRCYEIIIRTSEGEALRIKQGMERVSWKSGLRVVFNSRKTINAGNNQATLNIFNLNENNRNKIVKYPEEYDRYFQVVIRAGYPTDINEIFRGNILEASTTKDAEDFITRIDTIEGIYDMQNAYIVQTVKGNDTEIINEISKTLTDTSIGGYTKTDRESIRGKILMGKSFDVLEKIAFEQDKKLFVDNGRVNLLGNDEVVSTQAFLLNSSNIKGTPTKINRIVNVSIYTEPSIKLGGLVNLNSTAGHLNGIYRIETIVTNFDSHQGECSQDLELREMKNYRKVEVNERRTNR